MMKRWLWVLLMVLVVADTYTFAQESIKPIRTLSGHMRAVGSVAFSSDGKLLASVTCEKIGDNKCAQEEIKLWEVSTGRQLRTLTGHTSDVQSVAFSPDGKTLASGSWDKTIKLWDVKTGSLIRTLAGKEYVNSVAFSPDGLILASGGPTIDLWNPTTGMHLFSCPFEARSLGWSPDGKLFVAAGKSGIATWKVHTGMATWLEPLRTFYTRSGCWVTFSPDGATLASHSCHDSTIKLWDVKTGTLIRTVSGNMHDVESVAFSPNGNTLASGLEGTTIKFWDVKTGTLIRTLSGYTRWVYSVAFSPDGRLLASGSGYGTILIWDVAAILHPN